MFYECEVYCCDGLYLSEESLKELNIKKTNGIGIVALLQDYSQVIGIKEGNVVNIDKKIFFDKVISSNEEICYMIRKNALVIPFIKVYYGIKSNDQIIVLYENKQIRDAKLSMVKRESFHSILGDITVQQKMVAEVQKQFRLKKIYNSLV